MIFIASLVLLLIIKLRFPKGKSFHCKIKYFNILVVMFSIDGIEDSLVLTFFLLVNNQQGIFFYKKKKKKKSLLIINQ